MATLRELTLGTPPAEASLFQSLSKRSSWPARNAQKVHWSSNFGRPAQDRKPFFFLSQQSRSIRKHRPSFVVMKKHQRSEYTLTNFMCVHVSHIKTIQIQTDG